MDEPFNTDKLILRLVNGDVLTDAEHDAFLMHDRQLYGAVLMLSPLASET